MTSLRRSTRARTTRQSYVEVPESDGDTMEEPVAEEPSSSKPHRGSRGRPLVLDSDDELDESTLSSATGPVTPLACGQEQIEASASERVSKRRGSVVLDTDDEFDESTLSSAAGSANPDCGGKSKAPASKRVATALRRQATLWDYSLARVPKAERPMGDKLAVDANVPEPCASGAEAEAAEANSKIPEPCASGVDAGEDSDEEDEFIPGPDPNIADEVGDEPEVFDLFAELEDADAEVDEDFARKLRIILDLLCDWAKSISFEDFRGLPSEDRPVSCSTYRVLAKVSVEFLLRLCLRAIPLQVQELFSKKEWRLEDVLSLPKVEANDHDDQGLYANFPTGDLQHATKIGCECYVGSTAKMLRRINEHLKISKKHSVRTLPDPLSRSFHYRTTCRANVICNFRKLAVFKRRIPAGYLTIMESVFMILFGSYNYPGYYSKWATKPSYELVEKIRGQLDLAPVVWKGLNAALPLRQGTRSRNCWTPSKCCNPACETMTYPRKMIPDGMVKYNRCLANPSDPLGGYWCDRCERHFMRHGVLPDKAKLEQLAFDYALEASVNDLRESGQAVVCSNCGANEGDNGVTRRHILSDGKIRCVACDTYVRLNDGRERDTSLHTRRLIRDQANADRAAGRPINCKYCNKVEPAGVIPKKRWVASKQGGMVCRYCYDKKGRR